MYADDGRATLPSVDVFRFGNTYLALYSRVSKGILCNYRNRWANRPNPCTRLVDTRSTDE